jgi:hypothetical protein
MMRKSRLEGRAGSVCDSPLSSTLLDRTGHHRRRAGQYILLDLPPTGGNILLDFTLTGGLSAGSRPIMKPKLEYVIELINATPEQSFPPGNSVRKASCCVSSSPDQSFGGGRHKPDISGRNNAKRPALPNDLVICIITPRLIFGCG